MIFQASFIIRPKPELRAALLGSDLGGTPFETEPVLWTCDITDRTSWSREDVVAGIKEAFLYDLGNEFLSPLEKARLGLEAELNAIAFDQFWTIESFFGADQRFEDAVIAIPSTVTVANRFLRAHCEKVRNEVK